MMSYTMQISLTSCIIKVEACGDLNLALQFHDVPWHVSPRPKLNSDLDSSQVLHRRHTMVTLHNVSAHRRGYSVGQVTAQLCHFVDGQGSCFRCAEAPLFLFLFGEQHWPEQVVCKSCPLRWKKMWIWWYHDDIWYIWWMLIACPDEWKEMVAWFALMSCPHPSSNIQSALAFLFLSRSFRTTNTGRVSAGGVSSTRRIFPKGSSCSTSETWSTWQGISNVTQKKPTVMLCFLGIKP